MKTQLMLTGALALAGCGNAAQDAAQVEQTRWRIDHLINYTYAPDDLVTVKLEYDYEAKQVDGKPQLVVEGIHSITLLHDLPPYGTLDGVTFLQRSSPNDPWPLKAEVIRQGDP